MAVTFVAASHANFTSGSVTSVSMTEPTGTAQNDVLLLTGIAANATVQPGVTIPSGWTGFGDGVIKFAPLSAGIFADVVFAWVLRGASAPTLSLAWTNAASYWEWSLTAWRGCLTSGNPFSDYGIINPTSLTGTTGLDCPPTSVKVGDLAVAAGMYWVGNGTAWTAPAGYTLADTGAAGTDIAVAYKSITVDGIDDPAVFGGVGSATVSSYTGLTVALRSAVRTILPAPQSVVVPSKLYLPRAPFALGQPDYSPGFAQPLIAQSEIFGGPIAMPFPASPSTFVPRVIWI